MQTIEFNHEWKMRLLNRFLTYVKIYSTSDAESETTPSSPQQWDIAKYIFQELQDLGLSDVSMDENGYIMAYVPSNISENEPTVGFIAHYDTSPDFNGKDVNPQIWEDYNGGDLVLNQETGFTLSSEKFPSLKKYVGKTLITTDGTSLLGADDKAGVAEIVTAAEYLLAHPDIKHGRIAIGFTPDEEIGRGAHKFDVAKFGAEYAYTMDGSEVGELEYENFNAASVTIKIVGNNVHPGSAKGVMVNALSLAARIHAEVPADESPEKTEGYEGFYHLASMKGTVDRADMHYIIRDFDRKQFEARKRKMMEIAKKVGKGLHPDCYIELVIEDDGCGLPPGSGQQGFGLAGMRERVKALGGTLNLSCTHGTRVSVSLPLRSYHV